MNLLHPVTRPSSKRRRGELPPAGGGSAQSTAPDDTMVKCRSTNPHRIARAYLARCGNDEQRRLTLRHHRCQYWRYTGTKYQSVSRGDMDASFTEHCNRHFIETKAVDAWGCLPAVTISITKNVDQAVSALTHVGDDREMPTWLGREGRGPFLAFQNGLLHFNYVDSVIGSGHLRHHTPEWFSPVCFTYNFDSKATCPQWLSFLGQVLEGDHERLAILQEWMGLSLVFDMSMQRFLVMIGEGGNGKGVIARTWESLLDPSNVSSVALERFGERFALHGTLGKLVNFCNEPGPLSPAAENMLKSVVGQDRVVFERKHQDPFEAFATTRIVVLTNNAPTFKDRSVGTWRRAMFLPFNVTIPPEKQDKTLTSKMKAELPGIFNWALVGYQRLKGTGEFTTSTVCQVAFEEFRADANPAREFLTDRCGWDAASAVDADVLYGTYRAWALAHGHQPLDSREFGKEIRRKYPDADHKRQTVDGDRKYHYFGLRLLAIAAGT